MICLCIKCGRKKRGHRHKCKACGFRPKTTGDIARSLYLSRGMFTEDERKESPEFVPEDYSEEHLLQIGSGIAAGILYEYNDARLSKLLAQAEAVSSVNSRALLWWFVRFLGPPIVLLAGLWSIVWLLKSVR